jgi:hypothetical protein
MNANVRVSLNRLWVLLSDNLRDLGSWSMTDIWLSL